MTTDPLVSVIVATYRRDSSLKGALESLANQTYKNIEIILVDDNDDYGWNQKVNPSVMFTVFQNHPNQGAAKARNRGIDEAHGEYLTFLDDDDLYLPEKIENQLRKMQNHFADFSLTDLYLYTQEEKLVGKRIHRHLDKNLDVYKLLEYHFKYHLTGTDTIMFRKNYLIETGKFPPIDIGDEFYLITEAILHQGEFLYIPGCFVKAYVHKNEEGLSTSVKRIEGENVLFAYKKRFFGFISKKSQKYIKMRHYAVIAFIELKKRKYFKFLLNSIKSFLISPLSCIKLFINIKH